MQIGTFKKGINWLLYSNIFIAFCALAMTVQSLFLLHQDWKTSPALLGLVFFSTWFIYALHRLVSWQKLDDNLAIPRFQIIGNYKLHIQVYAGIAAVVAGVCFCFLEWATQLALVLPALLSLGYVLPFIGKQQLRLRDLHFVKIFLIAIVWAYVTVLLPILETGTHTSFSSTGGLFLERTLFIFIITLPFDLRDWKLDEHHAVKTIPTVLGPQNTIYLGLFLLIIWNVLVTFLHPWPATLGFYGTSLGTAILLWYTLDRKTNSPELSIVEQDYYYTGLIDGTMILQALLVVGIIIGLG